MTQQTYAPSQLGVRPDARLAQAFLTQAFFWMFLGLLVTTAVGVMVSSLSMETIANLAGFSIFLIIAQLGIAFGLTLAIRKISATVGPPPLLRLRGPDRHHARLRPDRCTSSGACSRRARPRPRSSARRRSTAR
jgi:predicted lipid-binding transport protein (Tim44 family)